MELLRPGMLVFAVNDLSIGEVALVLPCCFVVRDRDGRETFLKQDAIFNIVGPIVSLICMTDHISAYSCDWHGVKHSLAC